MIFAAYALAAGFIGFTATFKYFLSAAKDAQTDRIKKLDAEVASLTEKASDLEGQRDFLIEVQAKTAEIIRAKLDRLAAARDAVRISSDLKNIAIALAPRDQLILLMKMTYC